MTSRDGRKACGVMAAFRVWPDRVSAAAIQARRFDEPRGDKERAVYLRGLVHQPPRDTKAATHGEATVILPRLARDGRTTSANAPGKALPGEQPASELEEFLRDA